MHQYLEPFYKTTNNICTSKVPTVGLVLFFMDHISETIATGTRTNFMRNYSISHFSSMSSGYNAQEIEDGGSVSFGEEIAREKRRTSMSSATDELTQYLSEAPAPIPTDVLEWRKVNSTSLPLTVCNGLRFLGCAGNFSCA